MPGWSSLENSTTEACSGEGMASTGGNDGEEDEYAEALEVSVAVNSSTDKDGFDKMRPLAEICTSIWQQKIIEKGVHLIFGKNFG